MFSIDPIGTVRKVSENEVVIDLLPACRAGLHGIVPGDRLDVPYWMHKLPADQRRKLKVHPQGNGQRPLKGVFGLRSPMRPNPIGATVVQVVRVEGASLAVTGLDALDGSPVVDLKATRGIEEEKGPRWPRSG